MTAILAALCLRPSARAPPPVGVLLKTKAKVQFDRAVTERSKLLFCVFQPFQSGSISALFSRFNCPVGRGLQPVRGAALLSDYGLLDSYVFKDRPTTALSSLEGKQFNLPFVRPIGQAQTRDFPARS
jgi:hypothetical protein